MNAEPEMRAELQMSALTQCPPRGRGRQRGQRLALIAGLLLGAAEVEAELYRWVDEQGEVHYGDKVPPSVVEQGHTKITEEGIRAETVPPAPTEAEIHAAEERERRAAEEARRIAAERAAAQRLLSQYRTIDDLELAREGKIAALDAKIQVQRDAVRELQRHIVALDDRKRELEKTGETLPDALLRDLQATVMQIREGYAEVVALEYGKQALRQEFVETLRRYRDFKGLAQPEPTEQPEVGQLNLSILAQCTSAEQCQRYWKRATDYVRSHTQSRAEISGPGLLISFQADDREKRSLTLSWTQRAADEPVHLYLDVQCKNLQTGSLICINPTIPQIRAGFQSAVTGVTPPASAKDEAAGAAAAQESADHQGR